MSAGNAAETETLRGTSSHHQEGDCVLGDGACLAALHKMMSTHSAETKRDHRSPNPAFVGKRKWTLREGKGLATVILPLGSGARTSTSAQRGFLVGSLLQGPWQRFTRSVTCCLYGFIQKCASGLTLALGPWLSRQSITTSTNKPCQALQRECGGGSVPDLQLPFMCSSLVQEMRKRPRF